MTKFEPTPAEIKIYLGLTPVERLKRYAEDDYDRKLADLRPGMIAARELYYSVNQVSKVLDILPSVIRNICVPRPDGTKFGWIKREVRYDGRRTPHLSVDLVHWLKAEVTLNPAVSELVKPAPAWTETSFVPTPPKRKHTKRNSPRPH